MIGETIVRLSNLLEQLIRARRVSDQSHLLLVDDGSSDGTWQLISSHVSRGFPVVGVKLSRNRGHQSALLAGLLHSNGDVTVSVDADLQDDLNAIERMLDEYESGADIVYGVRNRRDSDSLFKRATARSFYRILTWSGVETVFDHADYRLLSRRALDALSGFREVNLYLRGIIPLLGFQSSIVKYDRAERYAGESKYPLRKMIGLAIVAITSFSVFPLRLISCVGFILSLGSFAATLWVLWVKMFTASSAIGWASTTLPIYIIGGLQLLALGIIGEYVAKIYMETKARPRFVIDTIIKADGRFGSRSA